MKHEIYGPDGNRFFKFFCPACRVPHEVCIEGTNAKHALLESDGKVDIVPGIEYRYLRAPDFPVRCDVKVRDSELQYGMECSHIYAGRIVAMPDIPQEYLEEDPPEDGEVQIESELLSPPATETEGLAEETEAP